MTATIPAPDLERQGAEFLEFDAYLSTATTEGDASPGGAEGLALPYGEILDRLHIPTGATRQVYKANSGKVRDTATFYFGHDHIEGQPPIGRVLGGDQLEKGLRLRTRFARTQKAAEIKALMTPDEDGKPVLSKFSVGYQPVAGYLDQDGEFGGTAEAPVYVHTEIDVFEVSVVDRPAFNNATIDSVLSERPGNRGLDKVRTQEEKNMTETLDAPVSKGDLNALSEKLDGVTGSVGDLERRIATLAHVGEENTLPAVPGRSRGEFVQMLASGDKDALTFLEYVQENPDGLLAYTGGVIADLGDHVKDSWVGDRYRAITASRRLHQLFDSRPLPETGMNVEFGKVLPTSDTTAVGEQEAEGDVLDYGKIAFGTDTAPVKTYGGWGDMSRQEIQRSGVNVVEKFFAVLDNKYATATEAALRTVVANVANSHAIAEAGTGTTDLTTPDGWTGFVLDAAFWLEDKGLVPEFVIVGRDKFKDLALMRQDGTDGDYFLNRGSGQISVTGLSGEIFNLTVVPVNSNGLVRVGHSSAICTYEDGRAPFRMQDSDITNLTDAFSIYGYEAIAVEDKDALVSPDVTGA